MDYLFDLKFCNCLCLSARWRHKSDIEQKCNFYWYRNHKSTAQLLWATKPEILWSPLCHFAKACFTTLVWRCKVVNFIRCVCYIICHWEIGWVSNFSIFLMSWQPQQHLRTLMVSFWDRTNYKKVHIFFHSNKMKCISLR